MGLLLVGPVLLVLAFDRLFPPPLSDLELSTVVADRHGAPLRVFPVREGRWRLPADLDRLDPRFIDAVITIEDKRFYHHPGVDAAAILRSLTTWMLEGEIRSGASTITMQTVRLLRPRPRTFGSKLIEAVRALQIEARMSKAEILSLYLTLTPYGGNLEGVEAASYAYFGRPPRTLAPEETALLIALPQAPEARRPDRQAEAAQRARSQILAKLVAAGVYTSAEAAGAAEVPVPTARSPFPSSAWHASDLVSGRAVAKTPLVTTFDTDLQKAAQRHLAAALETTGPDVQAAALVMDIEGRAVRALVGSVSRDRAGGWIDLTNRSRSPGSTLKPFVYGLAFDDGIAGPQTIIADLPARFASYQPDNFDRRFRGDVTIAEALQHSLNVPAVRVMDRIGSNRFLAALSYAGSSPRLPGGPHLDAGLAVTLGGAGLSAMDLAVLYGALGDGGRALPLAFTPEEVSANTARRGLSLLRPETATHLLDILAAAPSPAGRIPRSLTTDTAPIAFKTGTSYGFRDAWAVGVSLGRVIVVWVGRPDGQPRPGETGRRAALPILFDLFDAADRHLGKAQSGPKSATPLEETGPTRFRDETAPPQILFPPDGATLWIEHAQRSLTLTANGGAPLTWYVDGVPLTNHPGGASWHPAGPGFYRLSVIDHAGRTATTSVQVIVGTMTAPADDPL
ncbi:penicillin-binding protein, 1A family protein [Parvularcula bermudensis HTCC2503]|uniref:peptidoglycan glycosyltransferase n=1 Tax=Parvularcula bermudensis (strain ATCC BAA-594 / HTCC2503 / KCTC 12087) TaxID=314260 RepID=E0TCG8_PARBH|nr:penicillin-binding protein 1C [Parvularcula bermudensis]ADM10324.1 penicillin-binding protein, 1A family protein [Parvularcula bermudensis HTCC2503]